ncbi:MAG: hypothetical protein R3249_12055, partial [Nitriliruptorales bacterium]|nr:hypothetical protein [Nitriliruptorales bacterium]
DWFAAMRTAGVDVAALTDHAVMGKLHGDVTCSKATPVGDGCSPYVGINETSWGLLADLADAGDDPGSFVAMRGFEWTTGSRGHLNVWFSEEWVDALTTGSITEVRDADTLFDEVLGVELPPEIVSIIDSLPSTASIDGFWEWLAAPVGSLPLGGGADALAGLNHPNEFGNFENFKFFPNVADRVVSIEVFNGPAHTDVPLRDYWSWDVANGQPWPINAALNAGWRVGLLGVSDNHTSLVGDPNAARGGLWVTELTRAGVRDAMERRRMFASRLQGLRLDAAAHGVAMGSDVGHPGGPLPIEVDLDWGPDSWGEEIVIEVAVPGTDEPGQLAAVPATIPGPGDPVISFTVDVDPDEVPWLLLRICQPTFELDPNVVAGPWTAHGGAIAYSSPFWLQRADAPGAVSDDDETTPTTGAGTSSLLAGGIAIAAAAAVGARRRGHGHGHGHGHGVA